MELEATILQFTRIHNGTSSVKNPAVHPNRDPDQHKRECFVASETSNLSKRFHKNLSTTS